MVTPSHIASILTEDPDILVEWHDIAPLSGEERVGALQALLSDKALRFGRPRRFQQIRTRSTTTFRWRL